MISNVARTVIARAANGPVTVKRVTNMSALKIRTGCPNIFAAEGMSFQDGTLTFAPGAYQRFFDHSRSDIKDRMPAGSHTPDELASEHLLSMLGVIPASHCEGIGDFVSVAPEAPAPSKDEINEKRDRISSWLAERDKDMLVLKDLNMQQWLLGGIKLFEIIGKSVATLLVPKDLDEPITVIVNNIEEPRIIREELLGNIGPDWADIINLNTYQWDESLSPFGSTFISDEQDPTVHELHYSLMANDVKRYEWLARAVTAALVKSAFLIRFGEDTEAEIASRIGQILGRHNIIPEVLLVAGDENAFFTNHPMPREDYVVQNYALMVLCARWRGYIVNLTRIVSRGNVSDKLKKDLEICAMAAGTAQYLTKPGLPMRNVYDQMRRVFADAGYPNAWKSVHWGGPTGLGIRDFCVSQYTRSNVLFQEEQPFTWNPILPGVKVEETIISAPDLVTREPARTLTVDPYGWWPMGIVTLQDPAAEGLQSSYPMILER